MGELRTVVFTYFMEIECLEGYIMGLMIHNEDGHDFAVAHHARAISMTLSRYVYLVFFELRCKKLAEFIENTENFY